MYRTSPAAALHRIHLQTNSPHAVNMLTFDVDRDDADLYVKALAYDSERIPEPSWVTVNPGSGHAHVGYLLAIPVAQGGAARAKPLEYLTDIKTTLGSRLGADEAYSGFMTRNPAAPWAWTHWGPEQPYTLGELHTALGDLRKSGPAYDGGMDDFEDLKQELGLPEAGESGRHDALFQAVRTYSYRRWRHHYLDEDAQGLGRLTHEQDVVQQAQQFAAEHSPSNPLPAPEVESTARSIARWTWRSFDVGGYERAQQRGRERAMRRASFKTRAERVELLKGMHRHNETPSAKDVQALFNVSERTAYEYLEEAGINLSAPRLTFEQEVAQRRQAGESYNQIADALGKTKRQIQYAAKKAGKTAAAEAVAKAVANA